MAMERLHTLGPPAEATGLAFVRYWRGSLSDRLTGPVSKGRPRKTAALPHAARTAAYIDAEGRITRVKAVSLAQQGSLL